MVTLKLSEPVGATTTQWCPELMASHAPSWAVVGALKLLRNHDAVAGEKRASTSSITAQPAITHRHPSV